jgi:NADH:ubiquinone oxidoreductase subunit E
MDERTLDEIIERYPYPSGRTLGILREVQIKEKHIPMDTLKLVSEKLDTPLSDLFSLVTFYSFFSLKPVGEHLITVCMGTPCHVKGAVTESTSRQLLIISSPSRLHDVLEHAVWPLSCMSTGTFTDMLHLRRFLRY